MFSTVYNAKVVRGMSHIIVCTENFSLILCNKIQNQQTNTSLLQVPTYSNLHSIYNDNK